jgi:hypothetical protein
MMLDIWAMLPDSCLQLENKHEDWFPLFFISLATGSIPGYAA